MRDESESLKSTLLKCLCIGEFSAEAEWIDPCLSYILPEVICKFCGHCRDVDLCRDPYIYEKPNEFSHWRCLRCNKEYDSDEIEEILIQHLNADVLLLTGYEVSKVQVD
uniref:DNA polymerase epsilon catalytic subunit n=1 Tax=Romanomermis culicivorax TaxID=13658 RepID=A0A915ID88_ROMCU